MSPPDPHLDARVAMGLLSATDSISTTRRRFLQALGAGVGAAALGEWLPDGALRAAPIGADDGVLVVIGMLGGNDSMVTLAPTGDPDYERLRPRVRLEPGSGLAVGDGVELAPQLSGLKQRWDAGRVAIVQGVGCPSPNLSHFVSLARVMSGVVSGSPQSGWLGRWNDLQPTDELCRLLTVGRQVPLHMAGRRRRSVAVPAAPRQLFGATRRRSNAAMLDAIEMMGDRRAADGKWARALGGNMARAIDIASTVQPAYRTPTPVGDLPSKLATAARLINADIGARVVDTGWGDFDHHSDETTAHPLRMAEFDAAVTAFYDELDPAWRGRVTLMTWTEFGRSPWDNESDGADHGTSTVWFVIGDRVRGGLYGEPPRLDTIRRERDRFEVTTDFRRVYASVLGGWLGADPAAVLGDDYTPFDLFEGPPRR